ncbi:MAG: DciA family protein [Propionibacteriaceae bacterium]|nr:DciA family protein [Propionibacteriaceae bacterium]
MGDEPRSLGDILRRGVPPERQREGRGWDEPPPGAEPEPDREQADDALDGHDPTGLDLASRIAQSATVTGVPARPGARKPRRPRPDGSASRSRRDDPVPLGAAVGKLIEQRGWTRGVSLKLLLSDWPGLVGQANADHSRPEAYADAVLTVRADSTAWASSLRLLAPQLVAKLNAALGDGTVTRIEVLGPAAPSWKHGLRVVRDGRGPRDTYG